MSRRCSFRRVNDGARNALVDDFRNRSAAAVLAAPTYAAGRWPGTGMPAALSALLWPSLMRLKHDGRHPLGATEARAPDRSGLEQVPPSRRESRRAAGCDALGPVGKTGPNHCPRRCQWSAPAA